MDGSGGALNHADRIRAMHAGIGNHELIVDRPMSEKTGIIIVRGGTGSDTIIAPCATIQVDHHGGCAIDESTFDKKLQQTWINLIRFEIRF